MRLTMLGRTAYFAQNSQSKNKMRIKIMNGGGWKNKKLGRREGAELLKLCFKYRRRGSNPH